MEVGQTNRISGMDGLRGCSILFVLIGHSAGSANLPHFISVALDLIPGSLAVFGVEIFFLISGFIITHILLKKSELNFKDFYIKRAFKILPPLLVYFTFLFFVSIFTSFNLDLKGIIAGLLFIYNLQIFEVSNLCLHHLWSLSIEEQFYFVWPFALILLRKKSLRYASSIIIFVMIVQFASRLTFPNELILSAFRFQYILMGCLLALNYSKIITYLDSHYNLLIYISLSLVILSFLLRLGSTINPFSYEISTIIRSLGLGGLTIISTSNQRNIFYYVFNNRILGWLGLISYSIYIWQQFMFWPEPRYVGEVVNKSVFPLNMFLSILVGAVSYYTIEVNAFKCRSWVLRHHCKK